MNGRKKHRERTLKANPHTLYADDSLDQIDLIFYTTQIAAWKSTFCDEYKHVVKNSINAGERLTICQDEMLDTNNPILTISCYTNGTVLVQAYEASLKSFEQIFPRLKATVERKRDQTPDSPPSTSAHQQKEEQQCQAEERDQPQTAAEETKLSIAKLTDDFSELKSK